MFVKHTEKISNFNVLPTSVQSLYCAIIHQNNDTSKNFTKYRL